MTTNQNTPKQQLSFQFAQGDGVITFSACIPEAHIQTGGRLLWSLLGGGAIWVISHLPALPPLPVNPIQTPPPISTPAPNTQRTAEK
jgi:hypothetical protein